MVDLFNNITGIRHFKENYETILVQTATHEFPKIGSGTSPVKIVDWEYMLFAASVLAQSDSSQHLDIALRIANGCMLSTETNETQRNASTIIYMRLSNHPAVDLAIKREKLSANYQENLPTPLLLETIQEIISSTLVKVNGKEVQLNKFQQEFYQAVQENRFVSASAPTSAGKSFILNTIVEDLLLDDQGKNIVYVVPTRALINQLEEEFNAKFSKRKDVLVTSVPRKINATHLPTSKLFVLTQERLHWLMLENKDLHVDYLFVDEIQKIADDTRGILLQQKIEELQASQPECKFVYCSALSDNPQELLPSNQSESSDFVITRNAVVNQNLIWVSKTKGKPKVMSVNLMQENQTLDIGALYFEKNPGTSIAKLGSSVPLAMSEIEDGGVMIYVSEPSDAEKVAVDIAKHIKSNKLKTDVTDLIKVVKNNIHPNYVLANVLEKQVAFHYGNMPHVVRSEIERQFKAGTIKCLICTATLLEGVNLPAKTIYITSGKRSRKVPMSEADFWNLAGRAGRLTKELQGNIVCINPLDEKKWPVKPLWSAKRYSIRRSVDKITSNEDALLEYIEKHIESADHQHEQYEYVFSYYYSQYLVGTEDFRDTGTLSYDGILKLKDLCEKAFEKIDIPKDVILRNPGVSPLRQQRLVDRLREMKSQNQLVVPPHPKSDSAEDDYHAIACRAYKYLNPSYHSRTPIFLTYIAPLAVQWMGGLRLPVMISKNLKSKYHKDKKSNLSTVVRDTMRNLEEDIRFTFAKYLSCYVDLLSMVVLSKAENKQYVIPDVRTYLEFGVSEKTLVSLIVLGFDRNTAIALSKYIRKTDATEAECLRVIKELELSLLDLDEDVMSKILEIRAT